MKHPLKLHHQIGRELVCYFGGHKWKWAGQHTTQYYDLYDEDVPYSVRKRVGNHMWESNAWWTSKCTRCRLKLRDRSAYLPWYKEVWFGIIHGCSSMNLISQGWFGKNSEYCGPMWKRFIAFAPVLLSVGFQSFYIHLIDNHRFPLFPLDITSSIVEYFYIWAEME